MTVAPFPSASSVPVPAATRGPTRPLHLAAAIDGPGGSAELSPDGPAGPEAVCAALARLAKRGALDFVTLDAAPPTAADGASGHLAALPPPYPGDPLTLLARVAGTTDRIGLIAGVAAPATDDPPSVRAAAVASAIAALDRASQGRAGWAVGPAEDGSAPRRRAAERFVAAVVR
ncbi:MAG TPA: LLM class flavin-dependent oxidoreductase, partial [Streptomyces sp.]